MSGPLLSYTDCPALTDGPSHEASSDRGLVSNPATRNALSNDDILSEIFSYFDYARYLGLEANSRGIGSYLIHRRQGDIEKDIQRTRSLARLARVCKAFSEPALRVLWSQLYSLLPVFRLLPTLCKIEDNVKVRGFHGGSIYHLQSTYVPPHHWDRMCTYAGYVRELYNCGAFSSPSEHGDITLKSWKIIWPLLANRPLFPHLRILNCSMTLPRTDLPKIKIAALSPSLRSLSITFDMVRCYNTSRMAKLPSTWIAPLEKFVSQLQERVPQLVDLYFELYSLQLDWVAIPLSLNHPPSLRRLCLSNRFAIPSIGRPGLLALTHFAAIEELEITLHIRPETAMKMSTPVRLDTLYSLTIRHHADLNPMLDVLTAVQLRSLTLPDLCFHNFAAFQSTCAMWPQSFPQLESLSCSLGSHEDNLDRDTFWPLSSAFEKVLSLPRMRTFSVHFASWVPLRVNNEDLLTFARSWPLLETFSITVGHLVQPCLLVGLLGLHAFAENCPKLSKLRITEVHVRPEDDPHLPPNPPYPHHPLRTLDIQHGLDAGTYDIVRKRLFPNLV